MDKDLREELYMYFDTVGNSKFLDTVVEMSDADVEKLYKQLFLEEDEK